MHFIEDFLFLTLHLYAFLLSDGIQALSEFIEGDCTILYINNHHHIEILLHYGLRDVEDIDLFVGQIGTYGSDDTHGILSDYGDNDSVHCFKCL
jgi:hypothetical protein